MQVTRNVTAIQSGVPFVQTAVETPGETGSVYVGQSFDSPRAEAYQPSEEGMSALAQEFMERVQAAGIELDNLQKQGDENPYEDSTRAMQIAMNMMHGKRVPPKDEQFLMQYSNDLYQAAKMVQMMKECKEDAESALKDDESDASEKTRKLALDSAGETLVDSFDQTAAVSGEEAPVQEVNA